MLYELMLKTKIFIDNHNVLGLIRIFYEQLKINHNNINIRTDKSDHTYSPRFQIYSD